MKLETGARKRVGEWALAMVLAATAVCAAAEGGNTQAGKSTMEPPAAVPVNGGDAAGQEKSAEPAEKAKATSEIQLTENVTTDKLAVEVKGVPESANEVLANPDAVPPVSAKAENPWNQNRLFWERSYHRQVTPEMFRLIEYPYYRGGKAFDPEEEATVPSGNDGGKDAQTAENTEPVKNSAQPEPVQSKAAAESPPAENGTKGDLTEAGGTSTKESLEKYLPLTQMYEVVRLTHRWREMNESESFALEVLRSVELTRTSTQIYQIRPELAIAVKRSLGGIGILNLKLDRTIRDVLRRLAAREQAQYEIAHLRKLMADLESSITQLASQNDKISMELGLGAINRDSPFGTAPEPIRFSYLQQGIEVNSRPVSVVEAASKP